MPREAASKHVRVKLRNGLAPPESWPADGRHACRWSFTREGLASRGFDVLEWELAQ